MAFGLERASEIFSGREYKNVREFLAKERAEVAKIASNEMCGLGRDSAQQDRNVFFRQCNARRKVKAGSVEVI